MGPGCSRLHNRVWAKGNRHSRTRLADPGNSKCRGRCMSVSRVVDEHVLAPISEQKPAGDDLRAVKDWVEIRKARPNPNDRADKKDWEPANPTKADWPTYKQVVEKALCTKSKDLELGVFLTEACGRVHGFAGIRDGIWTLKGLLSEFSNRG